MADNKKKVDTTIGGNNYYYPSGQLTTQGQQNSLVGTGAVAGIPQNNITGINTTQNGILPASGTKVETTEGGNNYYYQGPAQGQNNSLVGTGAMAGIPQGPSLNLVEPINTQPEQQAQPEQPTVQPKTSGKKKATVTTPQVEPQQEQGPAEDIVNWEIPESWKKQEEQPVEDNSGNEQALANMEADLGQSTEGMLYGKVTADENGGNGIHTSADPYNVQAATNQARIANLKKLQGMSSEDIATSLSSGFSPYGEQAMADLQQYNPAKYEEVQKYLKQQQGQDAINSITMGTGTGLTSTEASVSSVNTGVDTWAEGLGGNAQETSYLVNSISQTMASNQVANTATQEMLNINGQLADLQYKLDNVYSEAKASFKGDVPDYIVKARASSLTQQYQAQIEKLQSRYNAAMDLYKTELSNAQWKEEMNLKYLQYQQSVNNEQRDRYYKTQQLAQNNIKRVNGTAYQLDPTTGTYTQMTDQTAYVSYASDVDKLMTGWTSQFYDGQYVGYECEHFTDNFTQASTGIRMEPQDGSNRGFTYAAEKWSYVNSLTPEVGSVVVAIGGAYDSTYGHTMLITGYDPTTGLMNLMWSNSNGDKTIHTSTTTMADIAKNSQYAGIRNPYITRQEQSAAQGTGNYSYSYFNTPMADVFDRLSADTNLTAAQKGKLPVAMEMYNTLYGIVSDGSRDELANNEDIALIYQDMKNQSFGTTNDDGAAFKKALNKSIRNRLAETTSGTPAYDALLNLQRLIELKLRDESGAAISSSEWMSNFSMLLPQAGESVTTKQNKLNTWNNIIATKFMSSGGTSKEYVPIGQSGTRQIW